MFGAGPNGLSKVNQRGGWYDEYPVDKDQYIEGLFEEHWEETKGYYYNKSFSEATSWVSVYVIKVFSIL